MQARPGRRTLLPIAAALALTAAALIPTVWSAHADAPSVTVLYKTSTPATNDEVDPWFELVNNPSSAIPYSGITIDYYFSDPTNETYDGDGAGGSLGCSYSN
jgi:hypothetical protein